MAVPALILISDMSVLGLYLVITAFCAEIMSLLLEHGGAVIAVGAFLFHRLVPCYEIALGIA